MAKAGEARPQADVGKVRGLRLHADEKLDSRRGGRLPAGQQELAGQEGAVQRAAVKGGDLRGHGFILRAPPPCLRSALPDDGVPGRIGGSIAATPPASSSGWLSRLAHLLDAHAQVAAPDLSAVGVQEVGRGRGQAGHHMIEPPSLDRMNIN